MLVVGGTGLLGAASAAELVRRGHAVRALARTRRAVPDGVELHLGDVATMTQTELRALLRGCTAVVFATGLDERINVRKPAYENFSAANNAPLGRLLDAALAEGVRGAVVHGSYFTHLARTRPDLELGRRHPYIHSRLDQAELALAYADRGLDVSVIEIPYVFGVQPGRLPGAAVIVEVVRRMPGVVLWPKGGVAAVTVRQVAQATAGALDVTRGAASYPIVGANLSWTELLGTFLRHLGRPGSRVATIPTPLFGGFARVRDVMLRVRGFEPGLAGSRLGALMSAEASIDPAEGSDLLGVTPDDLDAAIGESVRAVLNERRRRR